MPIGLAARIAAKKLAKLLANRKTKKIGKEAVTIGGLMTAGAAAGTLIPDGPIDKKNKRDMENEKKKKKQKRKRPVEKKKTKTKITIKVKPLKDIKVETKKEEKKRKEKEKKSGIKLNNRYGD